MYRTHRTNHDFQIAHFLAGKCHTPDGAYALLCDLKDDRQAAIANYYVCEKRSLAKELRAKNALGRGDEAGKLEAQADLDEIATGRAFGKILFDAAKGELAFIETCMAQLQPLRQFKHLPDPQAHEAAQHDEWKFELIARAENSLLCHGTIPPDELATMRAHPAFKSDIWPAIQTMKHQVTAGKGDSLLNARPAFQLPQIKDAA